MRGNAQLICTFVFTYAKIRFSFDAAHIAVIVFVQCNLSYYSGLCFIALIYLRSIYRISSLVYMYIFHDFRVLKPIISYFVPIF